jgi:hypothetical protein
MLVDSISQLKGGIELIVAHIKREEIGPCLAHCGLKSWSNGRSPGARAWRRSRAWARRWTCTWKHSWVKGNRHYPLAPVRNSITVQVCVAVCYAITVLVSEEINESLPIKLLCPKAILVITVFSIADSIVIAIRNISIVFLAYSAVLSAVKPDKAL